VPFAASTQYLGTSEILFSSGTESPRGAPGAEQAAVAFAYRCQTPVTAVPYGSLDSVRASRDLGKTLFVTDAQMALLPDLLEAVPGFIFDATQLAPDWSYILVGMEWETGVDEHVVFRAESPARDQSATYLAVVLREGKKPDLPTTFEGSNAIVDCLLRRVDSDTVVCACVRFAENEEVTALYRAMPVVSSVFQKICGHAVPSWDRDETEVHGSLLKGLVGGRMSYELQVDQEGRIMCRFFAPHGGLDCEIKIHQGPGGRHLVDYARVFADHAVVFEGQQIQV
jgi:hypothetical protein